MEIPKLLAHRRALAPVIANLLLIGITAVGGTITVGSAQNSFNSLQMSPGIDIDFVQFQGYDTRNSCTLIFYSGFEAPCGTGGLDPFTTFVKQYDERIAVYIVNHSAKKVLLSEVRFAGTVYSPTDSDLLTNWDDSVGFVPGQYAIMDSGSSLLVAENSEIQAGQIVTVVLDLETSIKIGRMTQMRITTGNGAVYVGDMIIGAHKIV